MAITKRNPERIFLGGPQPALVNDLAASEAITPGMLVELAVVSSRNAWRKHTTAAGPTRAVALDMPMLNKGVDDACAAADLIEVAELLPGDSFWGLIGSGFAVTFGAKYESRGDGTIQPFTSSTTPFRALETVAPGSANTRVRLEVI